MTKTPARSHRRRLFPLWCGARPTSRSADQTARPIRASATDGATGGMDRPAGRRKVDVAAEEWAWQWRKRCGGWGVTAGEWAWRRGSGRGGGRWAGRGGVGGAGGVGAGRGGKGSGGGGGKWAGRRRNGRGGGGMSVGGFTLGSVIIPGAATQAPRGCEGAASAEEGPAGEGLAGEGLAGERLARLRLVDPDEAVETRPDGQDADTRSSGGQDANGQGVNGRELDGPWGERRLGRELAGWGGPDLRG